MATLIHSNGTATTHTPQHGTYWSLSELQFLVGGYIEQVPTPTRHLAFCDEDGLGRRLPLNLRASTMLKAQLVGPVLVIARAEVVP